jgi:hypothetical protein
VANAQASAEDRQYADCIVGKLQSAGASLCVGKTASHQRPQEDFLV